MSKAQLVTPKAIDDISDEVLQNRIRVLYAGALAERDPIFNRMIDEFVRMAVKPNGGIIDVIKAPDLTAFFKDYKENLEKKSKQLTKENNLSEKVFEPLMAFANKTVEESLETLKDQKKAEEAVINRLRDRSLLQLPLFVVPITESYLKAREEKSNMGGGKVEGELPTRIAGTNLRTMDPAEKTPIINSLTSLKFPNYNISNILKNDRALDNDIAPMIQARMIEFFSDSVKVAGTNYDSINMQKLNNNKAQFIKAVETDLAVYEVSLEFVTQLQKKNPERQIDDTSRKEILDVLKVTLNREDAVALADKGGEIPNKMISKMNATVAGYDILSQSMKEVGGKREYTQRKDLIAALLPKIAEINHSDLEKNKKEITKLCAQAIDKYSSKSLPLIGDNTVSIKDGRLDKMKTALKTSLSKFQKTPKQAMDSHSLPSGMPLPGSRPVVDTNKAQINKPLQKPRPPTILFSETPSRPEPTKKQTAHKVVTAKSLAEWERSELMPAGMPQTQTAKDNNIRKSSNEYVSESKDKLSEELSEWKKNYKNVRNLPKSPSKNSDVGKSVQAWRKWHNENKNVLTTKGFVIPKNYEDVYKIASQYDTLEPLKTISDLQNEIRNSKPTPATFGSVSASINESKPSVPSTPKAVQKTTNRGLG